MCISKKPNIKKDKTNCNYKPPLWKKESMTADEMFKKLGFRKNNSECYSEEKGVLLYEIPIMHQSDCFSVYFKNGKVLYRNIACYSLWMDRSLIEAIAKKLEELGW